MSNFSTVTLILTALVCIEGMLLQGGQLEVDREPNAWWDEASKQWFTRISCGSFSFAASVPTSVSWTTPEGEAKFSSAYDESGELCLNLSCPGFQDSVDEQLALLKKKLLSLGAKPQVDLSGPCAEGSYEVIDDEWRSVNESNSENTKCDRGLKQGWYRFKHQGRNAVMPRFCVPKYECATDAPIWLDLRDQPLPAVGEQVDGRGCAHWSDDCCRWETSVTVRNCGHFFVYRLDSPPVCSLAFCTQLP